MANTEKTEGLMDWAEIVSVVAPGYPVWAQFATYDADGKTFTRWSARVELWAHIRHSDRIEHERPLLQLELIDRLTFVEGMVRHHDCAQLNRVTDFAGGHVFLGYTNEENADWILQGYIEDKLRGTENQPDENGNVQTERGMPGTQIAKCPGLAAEASGRSAGK